MKLDPNLQKTASATPLHNTPAQLPDFSLYIHTRTPPNKQAMHCKNSTSVARLCSSFVPFLWKKVLWSCLPHTPTPCIAYVLHLPEERCPSFSTGCRLLHLLLLFKDR